MFSFYSMFNQLAHPVTSMHVERVASGPLHSAAVSVHGWRNTQEDQHNILPQINEYGIILWAVYDGHGGHLCSTFLAKELPARLAKISDLTHCKQDILSICAQLDSYIISHSFDDGSTAVIVLGQYFDMKSGLALNKLPSDYSALLYPHIVLRLVSINIGDSRAIIFRSNETEYLALTVDHKPNNPKEHQRICAAGGYVKNNRVDGSLALSRSFGDKSYKSDPTLLSSQQKVIAAPDFQMSFLYPGDILFICCDGIFEAETMTFEATQQIVNLSRRYHSLTPSAPSQQHQQPQSQQQPQPPQQQLNDGVVTSPTAFSTPQISPPFPDTSLPTSSATIAPAATPLILPSPPTVTPSHPLVDSAGLARDLIRQSLFHGSRDNHTAIICQFATDLAPPIHPNGYEFIPGPCHSLVPDTSFLRCYRADIPSTVNFAELVPSIYAVDRDLMRQRTNNPHFQASFCVPGDFQAQTNLLSSSSVSQASGGAASSSASSTTTYPAAAATATAQNPDRLSAQQHDVDLILALPSQNHPSDVLPHSQDDSVMNSVSPGQHFAAPVASTRDDLASSTSTMTTIPTSSPLLEDDPDEDLSSISSRRKERLRNKLIRSKHNPSAASYNNDSHHGEDDNNGIVAVDNDHTARHYDDDGPSSAAAAGQLPHIFPNVDVPSKQRHHGTKRSGSSDHISNSNTNNTQGQGDDDDGKQAAPVQKYDPMLQILGYDTPYQREYGPTKTSLRPIYYLAGEITSHLWLQSILRHAMLHVEDCD